MSDNVRKDLCYNLRWKEAKRTWLLSFIGGSAVKDFAKTFYSSKAWKDCRESYRKSRQGLCEVCLAQGILTPAEIVHHKIEINPVNINDPTVTLSWENLQCVCRECHAKAHGATERRWAIDEEGYAVAKE